MSTTAKPTSTAAAAPALEEAFVGGQRIAGHATMTAHGMLGPAGAAAVARGILSGAVAYLQATGEGANIQQLVDSFMAAGGSTSPGLH